MSDRSKRVQAKASARAKPGTFYLRRERRSCGEHGEEERPFSPLPGRPKWLAHAGEREERAGTLISQSDPPGPSFSHLKSSVFPFPFSQSQREGGFGGGSSHLTSAERSRRSRRPSSRAATPSSWWPGLKCVIIGARGSTSAPADISCGA